MGYICISKKREESSKSLASHPHIIPPSSPKAPKLQKAPNPDIFYRNPHIIPPHIFSRFTQKKNKKKALRNLHDLHLQLHVQRHGPFKQRPLEVLLQVRGFERSMGGWKVGPGWKGVAPRGRGWRGGWKPEDSGPGKIGEC